MRRNMRIAKEIKMRAVVKDHNNGADIKKLAKKYGLSTMTIRNYIREDEEERKNKAALLKKEAERAKAKAKRDEERRAPIEERSALATERRQRGIKDIQAGMPKEEIQKREGLSRDTINDYIRNGILPTGAERICAGVSIRHMRKWAKDKIARQINTPSGKMTVCEVYPNFMRVTSGKNMESFTLGELYYMNER